MAFSDEELNIELPEEYKDNEVLTPIDEMRAEVPTINPVDKKPSLIDAALRKENLLGNVIDYFHKEKFPVDSDYDPSTFDYSNYDTKRRLLLRDSKSPRETSQLLAQFEQEDIDSEALDESGWAGIGARISMGVLSPESFLPIFGQATKIGALAKTSNVALNIAGQEGARQTFLYSQQSDKTAEDALKETAFATVLVGGITAGLHGVGKVLEKGKSPIIDDISDEINNHLDNENIIEPEIIDDIVIKDIAPDFRDHIKNTTETLLSDEPSLESQAQILAREKGMSVKKAENEILLAQDTEARVLAFRQEIEDVKDINLDIDHAIVDSQLEPFIFDVKKMGTSLSEYTIPETRAMLNDVIQDPKVPENVKKVLIKRMSKVLQETRDEFGTTLNILKQEVEPNSAETLKKVEDINTKINELSAAKKNGKKKGKQYTSFTKATNTISQIDDLLYDPTITTKIKENYINKIHDLLINQNLNLGDSKISYYIKKIQSSPIYKINDFIQKKLKENLIDGSKLDRVKKLSADSSGRDNLVHTLTETSEDLPLNNLSLNEAFDDEAKRLINASTIGTNKKYKIETDSVDEFSPVRYVREHYYKDDVFDYEKAYEDVINSGLVSEVDLKIIEDLKSKISDIPDTLDEADKLVAELINGENVKLYSKELEDITLNLASDLRGNENLSEIENTIASPTQFGGVGADGNVGDITDVDYKLVNEGMVKAMGFGPSVRLATTPLHEARKAYYKLTYDGFQRVGEQFDLVKDDVETAVNNWKNKYSSIIIDGEDTYNGYLKRIKAEGEKPLSRTEFDERVGSSLRKEEVDDIPEVSAVAKKARLFLNEFKHDIEKSGYMEKADVKFALSYFPRSYNIAYLKSAQGGHDFKSMLEHVFSQRKEFEEEDIDQIVETIYKNIIGDKVSLLSDMNDVVINKIAKARTLNIADSKLEPFLNSDYKAVLANYTHKMGAHLEFYKRFETKDPDKIFEDIILERDDMLQKAGGEEFTNLTRWYDTAKVKINDEEGIRKLDAEFKTKALALQNKEINKIWQDYEQTIIDLNLVLTRLGLKTPQYDPVTNLRTFSKVVKTFTNITTLGGVTISAMPDIIRLSLRSGLKPIAKAFSAFSDNPTLAKASLAEKKRIVAAVELVQNNRIAAIIGDDDYGMAHEAGKIDKAADAVNEKFFKLTGMTHWNAYLKTLNSYTMSSKLYDDAKILKEGGTLSTKLKAYHNSLGLSESDLIEYANMVEKYGNTNGDIVVLNSHLWDEVEGGKNIANKISDALIRDSNNKIITLSTADLQSAFDDPLLSLVLQYKSFAMAAWNRMFVGSFQNPDVNTALVLIGSIGMGGVVAVAKRSMKTDNRKKRNINEKMLDAIDYSGVGTLIFELSRMSEILTGNKYSLNSMVKGSGSVKAYNRNTLSLFGPSIGKLETLKNLTSRTANNKESKYYQYRSLVPGANLPYVRIFSNVFLPADQNSKKSTRKF